MPINTIPSFAGDDLVSWHNPEFLADPAFIHAVELGNDRNSWDLRRDVRWRYHVILWAAWRAARLEGDFVECGVNRGGFSRAVVDYLDFGRLDKTFYLMDTFSGLVEQYITPEERAKGVSRESYAKYGECFDDVQEAFRPFPNVVLVRGPIPDTLPQVTPAKVSYLSIDMNVVIGRPTRMIWDRRTGMPISSVMSLASGSIRACRPSAMRWRYLERSSTEVSAHPGNASFAAATALSTSAALPCGIRPTTPGRRGHCRPGDLHRGLPCAKLSPCPIPRGVHQAATGRL